MTVVWEPYALAVFFGLVVSTAIYFIVMWPQVEPLEGDDLAQADADALTAVSADPAESSARPTA